MDADDTALVVLSGTIGELCRQLDDTRAHGTRKILKHTIAILLGRLTPVVTIRSENVVAFPRGGE